MASGRIVFEGQPVTLTDHIARELYDLEADEVMGASDQNALAGLSGIRFRSVAAA